MARHFDHRTIFVSPGSSTPVRFDSHRAAPQQLSIADEETSPVRVMLIAIRHDPEPPVFVGPHLLQRLQALLAAPAERMRQVSFNPAAGPGFAESVPADEVQTAPALSPARLLPPLPAPPNDPQTLHPRLVRGDILSDSAGQLYERFGQQLRPLNRVVSGPRGEILELMPRFPGNPAGNRQEPNAGVVGAEPVSDERFDPVATTTSSLSAKSSNASVALNNRPAFIRQSVPVPHRPRPDLRRKPIARPGESNQSRQSPIASPVQQTQREFQPPSVPQPVPANPEATGSPIAVAELKTAIPEQWLKPWEFRISREEALYDQQHEASARLSLFDTVRNLKRRFGTNEAFCKWQSLLSGRNPEEQLWDVRPPTGLFAHPQVREWARQTLALAGYDSRMMLPEWEIFWRRKGV